MLEAKIGNNRGRQVRPVWACNLSRVRVLCLEFYYNPIWKGVHPLWPINIKAAAD